MDENIENPEKFWEDLYAGRAARPLDSGPNAVLAAIMTGLGLPAGDALDLGCAEGADAVWLGQLGWNVTGVDVSETALERARARAEHAGLGGRIRTERHDLGGSFPTGHFDLVNAQYLQTPLTFPRARVLRQAAAAVRPGGLLLIVDHASVAPWSWNRGLDAVFPTPRETLATLDLHPGDWIEHRVEAATRQAIGPGGQRATVTDNVMALHRRAHETGEATRARGSHVVPRSRTH
ncbi:SAM-dependent methyltransferase [Glaciibacter psychrotolerans]|uniref:SAM-dependent methyltransferase n=1 Tax=Glaciibacter psychrotolerans TaxID=670054 RepID=A0A7Z0EEE1_9MICO|nr:class I SAM-dependent methyltransferase [Leifsonia psychrotolerans]NYJ20111.1 SAM-dependent methyltransferase [Leifsonia psychrotolerans]